MSMRRSSLGLCSKLLLKKNIVSNYVGQTYVACVNIAFVPVYVNYIGAEAYGLVGFYAMLQSWFSLLDMGLSPTLGREAARHSVSMRPSSQIRSRGAICTNDLAQAQRIRLMTNFGFAGFDNVVHIGTNGKMTEVCAAMGLTSLELIDDLIAVNRRNHEIYAHFLSGVPGIRLNRYDPAEKTNFQYIVVEVDRDVTGLTRDELVAVLHAENELARKYFWPGCHMMEPYRSRNTDSDILVPKTNVTAARVIVLPTGQSVDQRSIETIAAILHAAVRKASHVRSRLGFVSNT